MPTSGVLFTGTGTGYTENVVIGDNKFAPEPGTPYTMVAAPQNAQDDERLRNIIFERNWFTTAEYAATGIAIALNMDGSEFTVRNNICDMTGASAFRTCFGVNTTATDATPPNNNIRIYNNTAYQSDAGIDQNFQLVQVSTATTNLTVENNLAYAPLAPTASLINGTAGSGFTQLNNSTPTEIKNTSPVFTNMPPSVPADFVPLPGSYAIGKGTNVPVWSDFFQAAEPATRDMGAIH